MNILNEISHNVNKLRMACEELSETEVLWILGILYGLLDIQFICFTLSSQLKFNTNES